MTTEREILIASLKGEFSDFEIINIDLSASKDGGPMQAHSVLAVWICDMWAIHKSINADGYWTLTHIPTGLAVHHDSTLVAVLMALGAIISADLPWDMVVTAEDATRMRKGLSAQTKQLVKTLQSIYSLEIPATKEVEEYA